MRHSVRTLRRADLGLHLAHGIIHELQEVQLAALGAFAANVAQVV